MISVAIMETQSSLRAFWVQLKVSISGKEPEETEDVSNPFTTEVESYVGCCGYTIRT